MSLRNPCNWLHSYLIVQYFVLLFTFNSFFFKTPSRSVSNCSNFHSATWNPKFGQKGDFWKSLNLTFQLLILESMFNCSNHLFPRVSNNGSVWPPLCTKETWVLCAYLRYVTCQWYLLDGIAIGLIDLNQYIYKLVLDNLSTQGPHHLYQIVAECASVCLCAHLRGHRNSFPLSFYFSAQLFNYSILHPFVQFPA